MGSSRDSSCRLRLHLPSRFYELPAHATVSVGLNTVISDIHSHTKSHTTYTRNAHKSLALRSQLCRVLISDTINRTHESILTWIFIRSDAIDIYVYILVITHLLSFLFLFLSPHFWQVRQADNC